MIYVIGIIVLYLLGKGTLKALYREDSVKDMGVADAMLMGGLVVIGLAEAAHMGAVVMGRSFSDCVFLFLVGLLVLLIGVAVLLLINFFKHKPRKMPKPISKEEKLFALVWLAMILIQLLLLVDGGRVYLAGDMTVETVNTMLTTDSIYRINPLTGQSYVQGVPMRIKILCLPTLYAVLCDIFKNSATELVWNRIPVFTLLGCYAAFYCVAKSLFPEESRKRSIFMTAVALLLWMGNYLYGVDGFALQYAGARGVSVRMLVLLPFTISLVLRRKWKAAFLCVLAEACIVWTTYGMGMCLLTIALMALVKVAGLQWGKISRSAQGTVSKDAGEDNR